MTSFKLFVVGYALLITHYSLPITHFFAPSPAASLWYRGTPAGVPRQDDLALIRALGFSTVTWPARSVAGTAELKRLATLVGLTVVIRDEAGLLTAASALRPDEQVDVQVGTMPADYVTAIVWRAIAHGARLVSFDAGVVVGSGLHDSRGRTPDWVRPASALARQLEFNARLIEALKPGPAITTDPPTPATLDLSLLDAGRAWVIVATNASDRRVKAVARLPKGVPYALWLNVLDGSSLAMLSDTTGPRWSFELAGWGVGVYVIDKTLR